MLYQTWIHETNPVHLKSVNAAMLKNRGQRSLKMNTCGVIKIPDVVAGYFSVNYEGDFNLLQDSSNKIERSCIQARFGNKLTLYFSTIKYYNIVDSPMERIVTLR